MTKHCNCFLDSARGIYIPRDFAESISLNDWTGIDKADFEILLSGPDHEDYWEAWTQVLDNAESNCGATLYQDGDLFLVYREKALADLNGYLESVVEYETRHCDAGENYAYLVTESNPDLQDIARQLAEEKLLQGPTETALDAAWTKKLDLNLRGLDVETVANLALECFEMVSGNIWGPCEDGLVIAAYPVQEIETEIPNMFDGLVLDLIGDNGSDAYIPDGGRLAYIATDAVWYAVANVEKLQAEIDSYVAERTENHG
jgi:hypothetical protein